MENQWQYPQNEEDKLHPRRNLKIAAYDVKSIDGEHILVGPTNDVCQEWTQAYVFFNNKLFAGELPPSLITLQRKRNARGYFAGQRFINVNQGLITDELAKNPSTMSGRTIPQILSTLAHEQCHVWQFHFSQYQSRRGVVRPYHDLEWAEKMISIGLMPSNTEEPNGNKTGRHVTHYILEGGVFERTCADLLATGFTLSWHENLTRQESGKAGKSEKPKKDPSKTKFTCHQCGQNAWARQTARLVCGNSECGGTPMTAI